MTEARQWVPLGDNAWTWVCGSLWVSGNVLCLDPAGDSTGVLIWNNSLSHTLKTSALYCMLYLNKDVLIANKHITVLVSKLAEEEV